VATSETRWHPEAIADAEEARDWYAARSLLAARGFLLELQAALESILEAPARWPEYLHGTRRRPFTHRYPYSIVYREGPPVVVIAVSHSRRRPGFWRDRELLPPAR